MRSGVIFSVILWYYGLREEPEKIKKIEPKKEVKVEESLFRISKRPEHITEEEIMFHKEQEICLVCKGNVGGFSFICIDCGTFYCQNCANSLINLENVCWVCNTPIDPSKPSKPYEKEDEEPKLKISEEIQKNKKY